jgi:hypothetical protein
MTHLLREGGRHAGRGSTGHQMSGPQPAVRNQVLSWHGKVG